MSAPKKTSKTSTTQPPSAIAKNTVILLTIPKKVAEEAYQAALNSLAPQVSAEGFRKGKVPLPIAESIIGPAKITEKALIKTLPAIYQAEIVKQKKRPLIEPEFNPLHLHLGEDWTVEAHLAEAAEVNLGDYKKVASKARKEAEKEFADKQKASPADKTDKANKQTKDKGPTDDFLLQHIFRDLVLHCGPQVAELLVRHETQHELEDLLHTLTQLKMELDTYLERRKLSREQLYQELAMSALSRLQIEFILGKIAQEMKFKVSPKDIETQIGKIEDKKVRQQAQQDDEYKMRLESSLIKQQVVQHLLSL